MIPEPVELTMAQQTRLDLLPDDCRVVGACGNDPVLRHASGRLVVVEGNGEVHRAGVVVRENIEHRLIDDLLPRR